MWPAIGLVLGIFSVGVFGQTTHVVQVGLEGSFYDPPTVAALEGDIVSFVFSGLIHGVTQSAFENPCVPLPGGFSSGIAGVGTNDSATPVWNLKITNVSEPIWYYCLISEPESHCEAGMVGAINAPAEMFDQFQSSAKAVTSTMSPTVTVILSGVGAFATNSPVPTTTFSVASDVTVTETPSFTPSPSPQTSSSTSTSSAPAATTTTKSAVSGAVIGGAVGGGVAIVAVALLAFCLLRRRKPAKRQSLAPYYETSERVNFPKVGFVTPQHTGGNGGGDRSPPVALRPSLPYDPYAGPASNPSAARSQDSMAIHRQQSTGAFSGSLNRDESMSTTHHGTMSPMPASDVDENGQQPLIVGAQSIPMGLPAGMETRSVRHADSRSEVLPPPMQQNERQRSPPIANVHEIAKEVAALLGPSMRSPPPGPPVSSADGVIAPRPVRQLPNPRNFGPKSPGPPQYERYL